MDFVGGYYELTFSSGVGDIVLRITPSGGWTYTGDQDVFVGDSDLTHKVTIEQIADGIANSIHDANPSYWGSVSKSSITANGNAVEIYP